MKQIEIEMHHTLGINNPADDETKALSQLNAP